MRKLISPWQGAILVLGMSIAMVSLTWAHGNEHQPKLEGTHGGMLRATEQYHLELLVEQERVRIWVTDHADNPQPTSGAQGRAMIASGDRRLSVTLAPEGDNELSGRHPDLRDADDLRVAVTVSMQGEGPVQARFTKVTQ
ncbi:hypothetical protein D5687_03350 [Guyparkeria sp. SCN-R1]|uniref:hypothetical protein n=1 Tax=Guyparkeria sp. SCN-R1 TaxID=2341113 RepID=UPI000F646D5D|nr:hypothetical protein [Guyparkeria sp. SCN-R1]RRQ24135.1 hypothetical protein D5687_03350 [Guyparkeria sp. SCN-R1]